MKKIQTAAVTAAFIAFAGMGMQANAEDVTEVTAESYGNHEQRVVNYADLDLTSVEGQEALHYRISRAAEQVCGSTDMRQAGGLAQAARNQDCYEESLSRALSQVNNSAVASAN